MGTVFRTMPILPLIESGYMRMLDVISARKRRPKPSASVLKACKLVAHRGEHDNRTVLENSLAAFGRAADAGVWGVELDVRWTRDLVPVVSHDADLSRLFDRPEQIAKLSFRELRGRVDVIPALAEVVERFGEKLHLMIEIKHHDWPDPKRQSRALLETLAPLAPAEAYHLMVLDPAIMTHLDGFTTRCMIAIAYHWPDRYSRWVIENGWGGLATHYSMLRRSHIKRHQSEGQCVGTAFPASRNCLFRELNRGVDFIFSNHAAALQTIIRRMSP